MKNEFYMKQKKQLDDHYSDGVWHGLLMGCDIAAIAAHNAFGFGADRLNKLEAEVQRIVDEVVCTNDAEVTHEHMRRAIEQARGKEFADKWERSFAKRHGTWRKSK